MPRLLPVSLLLLSGCSQQNLSVYNTPPNASITHPVEGAEFEEGETVELKGLVADDQESNTSLLVQWSSDLEGGLTELGYADASGEVVYATANLSGGNLVVTLLVVDSDGEAGTDTVGITVVEDPDDPELQVIHPVGGESGVEGAPFEFKVMVSDIQDDPEALLVTFESSLQGLFCTPEVELDGAARCEASLDVGDHYLLFTVEDTDGFTAWEEAFFPVISDDTVDNDEDGWTELQGDCDDSDPDISPSDEEVLNSKDDDCDEKVDEGTDVYDDDGDGFSEMDGDCDDGNDTIHPGATEDCDSTDEDCDEIVDEDTACSDDDGDGWSETETDCDDTDPTTYPGAQELEDGIDNDCDSEIDEGTNAFDDDGDGWTENEGDCDDDDDAINPDAEEECDGVDNDCDEDPDSEDAAGCTDYFPDVDGDLYGDEDDAGRCLCGTDGDYNVTNASDCYDANSDANPAETTYWDTHRGDGSYDFNCDGTETPRFGEVYECGWELNGLSLDCIEFPGWASGVADCGDTRSWATGCEFTLDLTEILELISGGEISSDYCSYTTTTSVTQECR